jgi:LDH2 family malate/lactate/ureidoglycolate dehydrogenase
MNDIVLVSPGKMKDAFLSILLKHRFEKDRAETCAEIFTKNTVDGVLYPWY